MTRGGRRRVSAPRLAAVLDPSMLNHALSGRANVRYLARVFDVDLVEAEVLKEAGLEGSDRPTGHYSLGMRLRLTIALAVSLRPELLVLDEPFNGLDPPGMRWARKAMKGVADVGGTVLVSSHLLGEIGSLCTELTILHQGRCVFTGTTTQLLRVGAAQAVVVTVPPAVEARAGDLLAAGFAAVERLGGGRFAVTGADPVDVNRTLGRAGIWAGQLDPRPSLEAVYLRILDDSSRRSR